MRHVRRKICPDSMFQKWQLWTKLHKFEKTAQLAALGLCSTLGRASSIKHNMRQFGDKTGNCNSQHKVWRTGRDGQESREDKGGWRMVGLAEEYSLCLYLPSVTCHVTRDMWRDPAVDAKCANHLDHSQLSGARVGGGRNIQTFKSSFVTFPTSSSF